MNLYWYWNHKYSYNSFFFQKIEFFTTLVCINPRVDFFHVQLFNFFMLPSQR
jgi:hypothetical protein